MKSTNGIIIGVAFMSLAIAGCGSENEPFSSNSEELTQSIAVEAATLKIEDYPAPSGLQMVSFGSSSWNIWPYTGGNFSGTPQDPINLIFVGKADPLDIRAALLSLDGDRSAFSLSADRRVSH